MNFKEKLVKHLLARATQEEADHHGLVTELVEIVSEDAGPGAGQITISCDGDSWTHYWSAMGEVTIAGFFRVADIGYLCGKLAPGLFSDRPAFNDDRWKDELCKIVIQRRKDGELSKAEARELWQDIEDAADYRDDDLWCSVCGCVYDPGAVYAYMPTEPNPKYVWLERVIRTAKMALECAGK